MSYTRKDIQTLMGVFGQILGGLSEREFKDLINGGGRLIYQPYPPCDEKRKLPHEEIPSKVPTSQVSQELVERLLLIESKEDAFFLLGKNLKKLILVEIAGVLNVYLRKSDTKEIITQKIVESTVGARLRFKAIKETDVGRKSTQE